MLQRLFGGGGGRQRLTATDGYPTDVNETSLKPSDGLIYAYNVINMMPPETLDR